MEKIKDFFAKHPEAKMVFRTSDGYLFWEHSYAKEHSKRLKNKEIEEFTPESFKAELEPDAIVTDDESDMDTEVNNILNLLNANMNTGTENKEGSPVEDIPVTTRITETVSQNELNEGETDQDQLPSVELPSAEAKEIPEIEKTFSQDKASGTESKVDSPVEDVPITQPVIHDQLPPVELPETGETSKEEKPIIQEKASKTNKNKK